LCRSDYLAAVAGFVERCFPEPDSDHIKRWARNILLRAEGEQAARILEMWRDEDVLDVDPRQIAIPTVILHGSADPIVPIDVSRRLAELPPDVELVELAGVGHVPTVTRPDEVVAAIRQRFA
jgi:pimeloyl-ACP methyl ester carboxylesterase